MGLGGCDQGCEHLTQILECGARAIALAGGILTRFLKGETERIKGYSSHEIIGSISVAFFPDTDRAADACPSFHLRDMIGARKHPPHYGNRVWPSCPVQGREDRAPQTLSTQNL